MTSDHRQGKDRDQPPELRALGRSLTFVLMGKRKPPLDGLPPYLAAAVTALVGRLVGP